MKTLHNEVCLNVREKISLELLNAYESLVAIHTTATSLVHTNSISEASQITLNNAVELSESCGGVLLMPRENRLEVLASIHGSSEVELYALKKASVDTSKPRYETGIKEAVSDCKGRFMRNTLSIPLMIGLCKEGLLFLFSTGKKRYTGIDVKLVSVLASQGVLAIKNLIHMNELQSKNQTLLDALDQLTAAQEKLVRTERLSAIGQMANMIVHDIKNPMGGLLGYAQLIHTTADDLSVDELKEYSGVIIKEMRRLSCLTDEIMGFSNGMDRKLDLREMKPRDLVNTAWPLIESELSSHDMRAVHGNEDIGTSVMADSDRMERVFLNLAVNARQAMKAGGSLTVDLRERNDWVEFAFRDSGEGIPEEIRKKIFEPFMTRKKGCSLGLGLPMARWITEAHGGGLFITETGAAGTEMVVRLPRAIDLDNEETA